MTVPTYDDEHGPLAIMDLERLNGTEVSYEHAKYGDPENPGKCGWDRMTSTDKHITTRIHRSFFPNGFVSTKE